MQRYAPIFVAMALVFLPLAIPRDTLLDLPAGHGSALERPCGAFC